MFIVMKHNGLQAMLERIDERTRFILQDVRILKKNQTQIFRDINQHDIRLALLEKNSAQPLSSGFGGWIMKMILKIFERK